MRVGLTGHVFREQYSANCRDRLARARVGTPCPFLFSSGHARAHTIFFAAGTRVPRPLFLGERNGILRCFCSIFGGFGVFGGESVERLGVRAHRRREVKNDPPQRQFLDPPLQNHQEYYKNI